MLSLGEHGWAVCVAPRRLKNLRQDGLRKWCTELGKVLSSAVEMVLQAKSFGQGCDAMLSCSSGYSES